MNLNDIAVFAHIIAGTILVMTLVIMQLVIGPAMAKLPNGAEKKSVMAIIQGRWHPVVDAVIIVQSVTALYFLATRWQIIGTTPILHFKVTFGIIALACANILHFYYRGLKRKLSATGQKERLKSTNQLTRYMEKVVLVTGGSAFLLGVIFNHF